MTNDIRGKTFTVDPEIEAGLYYGPELPKHVQQINDFDPALSPLPIFYARTGGRMGVVYVDGRAMREGKITAKHYDMILASLRVSKVEPLLHIDVVKIVGTNPAFHVVPPGEDIPAYRAIFTEDPDRGLILDYEVEL